MAAGLYDMLCEQGATFSRELTWKGETGDPIDLTGYSARMQVRKSVVDSTTVVELTTENGGIVIANPATLGKFRLYISATATADLTPMKGVYDLELEAADHRVVRLLQGKFTISAEVTR